MTTLFSTSETVVTIRATTTEDRKDRESHANPSESIAGIRPKSEKVASALALFALLAGDQAGAQRSARIINHRIARWKPLGCPRCAAPTAAKECFGERNT